jgi:osmoprotectant transport system substrate-binding protein
MRRRLAIGCVTASLTLVLSGCQSAAHEATEQAAIVRVGSYDFSENQILAEVYAQAIRRAGMKVSVVHGVGTRELVEPALEQGKIDFVVDYLGTALAFVAADATVDRGDPQQVYTALKAALAPRGITVLDFAPAQDQNGFAVTTDFANQHHVSRLSDLTPLAPTLTFGAPPECPTRKYCLIGLTQTYGLKFQSVVAIPTRDATVDALFSGEIDVGLLETTDARLSSTQLVLLKDDRDLQPSENVVPLVRTKTLTAQGTRLRAIIDKVSAQLSTQELVGLNSAVEIDGRTPAAVAADWVATLK